MGYGQTPAKEAETELVGLSRREMTAEGARRRQAKEDRSSMPRKERRKDGCTEFQEGR